MRWRANASCLICGVRRGPARKISSDSSIVQLQEQISGVAAQQDAKAKETTLIEQELKGVRELWKKNLIRSRSSRRSNASKRGSKGNAANSLPPPRRPRARSRRPNCKFSRSIRTSPAMSPRSCARSTARSANMSTQGHGRRPAQANRYPRAAGWHCLSVDCKHRRRRDYGR